jgi:hypothetical protein
MYLKQQSVLKRSRNRKSNGGKKRFVFSHHPGVA